MSMDNFMNDISNLHREYLQLSETHKENVNSIQSLENQINSCVDSSSEIQTKLISHQQLQTNASINNENEKLSLSQAKNLNAALLEQKEANRSKLASLEEEEKLERQKFMDELEQFIAECDDTFHEKEQKELADIQTYQQQIAHIEKELSAAEREWMESEDQRSLLVMLNYLQISVGNANSEIIKLQEEKNNITLDAHTAENELNTVESQAKNWTSLVQKTSQLKEKVDEMETSLQQTAEENQQLEQVLHTLEDQISRINEQIDDQMNQKSEYKNDIIGPPNGFQNINSFRNVKDSRVEQQTKHYAKIRNENLDNQNSSNLPKRYYPSYAQRSSNINNYSVSLKDSEHFASESDNDDQNDIIDNIKNSNKKTEQIENNDQDDDNDNINENSFLPSSDDVFQSMPAKKSASYFSPRVEKRIMLDDILENNNNPTFTDVSE